MYDNRGKFNQVRTIIGTPDEIGDPIPMIMSHAESIVDEDGWGANNEANAHMFAVIALPDAQNMMGYVATSVHPPHFKEDPELCLSMMREVLTERPETVVQFKRGMLSNLPEGSVYAGIIVVSEANMLPIFERFNDTKLKALAEALRRKNRERALLLAGDDEEARDMINTYLDRNVQNHPKRTEVRMAVGHFVGQRILHITRTRGVGGKSDVIEVKDSLTDSLPWGRLLDDLVAVGRLLEHAPPVPRPGA